MTTLPSTSMLCFQCRGTEVASVEFTTTLRRELRASDTVHTAHEEKQREVLRAWLQTNRSEN